MSLRTMLGALSMLVLVGCSNFRVIEPEDGSVITQPAQTRISFEGNPRITGSRVTVDGNDYSGQGAYAADNRWQAALTLPLGTHTVAVEADVPCWYCSGQSFRHTAAHTICVVAPGQLGGLLKTPLAQADGATWASVSDRQIAIESDAGSPRTRWNFRRLGGFTSDRGLIESAAFPCRCLRSMEDRSGAPVGFWACNQADPLQQWQALPVTPNRFRIQNLGRGVSDACLTEGPAPDRLLIQRNCNDTPDQVWSVRDNATGQPGSPFF